MVPVFIEQNQMNIDSQNIYKKDESKLVNITGQISSSKSPNTKLFQQHQKHLNHLFDTLKKRHLEQSRDGQHLDHLDTIQEQIEPTFDRAAVRKVNNSGAGKQGQYLAQRSTRNPGMVEAVAVSQDALGHGHTFDSHADSKSRSSGHRTSNTNTNTNQINNQQAQHGQVKNKKRNISKYESQE